jgi:hypothetical protein
MYYQRKETIMKLWDFLKRFWGMSLIGAGIIILALFAVIYAVSTGEGDEQFLVAKDGRELRLSTHDIPIACLYEKRATGELLHFEEARHELNKQLGFQLFSSCMPWMLADPFPLRPIKGGLLLLRAEVPPEEKEEDGVTFITPFDAKQGGSTIIYQDEETGLIKGSVIYVNPTASKNLKSRIWLHELGHAAGLDHDRIKESIMFPVASERSSHFTKRDLDLLKTTYR